MKTIMQYATLTVFGGVIFMVLLSLQMGLIGLEVVWSPEGYGPFYEWYIGMPKMPTHAVEYVYVPVEQMYSM